MFMMTEQYRYLLSKYHFYLAVYYAFFSFSLCFFDSNAITVLVITHVYCHFAFDSVGLVVGVRFNNVLEVECLVYSWL